jgi:5-oxopent-3-ene-1,2,5-tricarboxylate decarboxylase/2-hydroxyhepta-2,4-diene-1,7-dioate isomerase
MIDPGFQKVVTAAATWLPNALDVPTSGTVYGALLNFEGALAALGDAVNAAPYKAPPQAPILYIKSANTWIPSGAAIPLDGAEAAQMGATLGIVFGQDACKVSAGQALDYVLGYTIVNDVSLPHSSFYRPSVRLKCRDGFCPIGPWIVLRDHIKNPDALAIKVSINGTVVQQNSTANLLRPVRQLIAEVTDFMTLHAGDVLLVGVPENPPLAQAGDQVKIEIEGLGALENSVVGGAA